MSQAEAADQTAQKWVYKFGAGVADGTAEMKDLLGGKGANLAEMSNLGLPVPPGFTITTEVCKEYDESEKKDQMIEDLVEESLTYMSKIEERMGRKFGDSYNPLLVSVRSGAKESMPGMMDTVLNLGLCDGNLEGLIDALYDKASGDRAKAERTALDSFRRLLQMFGTTVFQKKKKNLKITMRQRR